MAQIGLRDEGRREWNFTLRGMGDRELLAAAELACKAADWQLCINTSERTREQIDLRQRYPMPFARGDHRPRTRTRAGPGLRVRPDPAGNPLHGDAALAAPAPRA
jgi:hypothetical protein